jgi:hypothetical protein
METRMYFIGLDPGVSGGIAMIDWTGVPTDIIKMPETEKDLLDFLRGLNCPIPGGKTSRAVLEKVHGGIAGTGGRRQGAAGMFTYGRNYGSILMGLTAAGIAFDLVAPQTWQKVVGVAYPKGSTQTERKNLSKRRAQQLFPSITVTHAIADALLIAEYCRRIHRGSYGKEEDRVAQDHTEATGPGVSAEGSIGRHKEGARQAHRNEITAAEARAAKPTASRHGAGPRSAAR